MEDARGGKGSANRWVYIVESLLLVPWRGGLGLVFYVELTHF